MPEKFDIENSPASENNAPESEYEKHERMKWEKYEKMKKDGTWIGPPPAEKTGYIPEDEFAFKGSEEEDGKIEIDDKDKIEREK